MTEERPITSVISVDLATIGDLNVVLGNQEKLIIEAEDNLLPYLTGNVSVGKLEIATQNGVNLQPTCPIHYTLTAKALDGLATSSSEGIKAPALNTSSFNINVSSTGSSTWPVWLPTNWTLRSPALAT